MKILTIFTALFMPISFISGFFGQNFEFLPFDNLFFFGLMLVLTFGTPILLWLWFKRQGWV